MKILYLLFFTIIFSQHGIDPAWSDAIALPKYNPEGSAKGVVGNNIVITSEEKIIIFYQEEFPFPNGQKRTYITTSNNNGIDWTAPILFSPPELVNGACCPNVSIDSENNVHVIWKSMMPLGIFYSKMDQDQNIIIDTVLVSNIISQNGGGATISVDGNDRIHAFWYDGSIELEDETAEIMYSRSIDNGSSWETAYMISLDDGLNSAFARIDFSGAMGDTLAVA